MYNAETQKVLRQGAVLRGVPFTVLNEARTGVVVTPECDIFQDKADTILAVVLFDANELITTSLLNEINPFSFPQLLDEGKLRASPSQGALSQLRERIDRLQKNQYPRYHWLQSPENSDGYCVADFQFIACIPIDLATSLDVANALDDIHTSSVVTRYASYITRVGTPDPDFGRLGDWSAEYVRSTFSA